MPLDREEIKREAKRILDKFVASISKVDIKEIIEKKDDRRKEKEGKLPDVEFRKIFFENAPAVKKECIEAEKAKWK